MLEVLPQIYVIPANGQKGFGYSHFVRLPAGNVLLARLNKASLSDAFADLGDAGGVRWVLVSDRHFGSPGCREVADRFDASLVASKIEAGAIAHRCRFDETLAFERQQIGDGGDIEAIPTPGHTKGQMAYLITVDGSRCLFAGDFAYRTKGKWRPGNKSRRVMSKGMENLRDVEFDYYIGCADYGESDSFVRVSHGIDDVADDILAACTRD